jgi:hypothetical protein
VGLGVVVLWLAGAAREKSNPVLGRWRTDGPSNLLFEYRADGTVHLIEETRTFQVFRYQLKEGSTIHLYDGMGRVRVYQYTIDGDEMIYSPITGSEKEGKETFRREK